METGFFSAGIKITRKNQLANAKRDFIKSLRGRDRSAGTIAREMRVNQRRGFFPDGNMKDEA